MKNLHKLIITLVFMVFSMIAIYAQTEVEYKITTWNVEWLSCLTYGPEDRELQINNVVSVIKQMNSDFVALQEVGTSSSYTTIDTLVKRLGSEWAGSIVPWSSSNCSQNQGVVYKKSKIQFIYASLITEGGSYYNWSAGRYPVLYDVDIKTETQRIPISFINIHAKAYKDADSYARRKEASIALKNYLDGNGFDSQPVVIIGDFNDYLIGTTCSSCGGLSPYKNFMDDVNHYKGLTTELKDPNYNNSTIDNIVISSELFDYYVTKSALLERAATQIIPNYRKTTSDHYPVSVTFKIDDEVSITEMRASQNINIYPNPTTGELRITNYDFHYPISAMQYEIVDVVIYDVYGRIQKIDARKSEVEISNIEINISHLERGIYFAKINTTEGVVIKKIVKQ